MATLTDLIAYVRSQSLVETDDLSTQRITTLINRGYHELSATRGWPWQFTSASLTVTAGDKTVDLPADFLLMGWVEDDDDQEVGNWYLDIPANHLVFHVEPTESETMTLYYYKSVSDLGDLDEPEFAMQFHFMLAEFALWKIHQREEMYRRAEVHRIEWLSMIEVMTRFYNQQGTGDLKFQIGQQDTNPAPTGNLPFLHA